MKNLIFISLMLICFSTNLLSQQSLAQLSLAQRTGYNTSLYDATCTLNGIVPGDVGMKEGRKLMQEYAKSIGLNYSLYDLNGKNNMYILHFIPVTNVNTNVDTNLTFNEAHSVNTQDLTEVVDSMSFQNESEMIELVTELVTELVVTDTVFMIDTITLIVNEVIVDTLTVIETKEYCDCEGLSVEDAWTKHEMLKDEWKSDRKNHNGAINSDCRVKLRQYIKYQESVQYDLTRIERNNTENVFGEPLLDAIQVNNNMVSTKPAKVTRKRKARKLGKGRSKGKNNSFWSKLFPFANC